MPKFAYKANTVDGREINKKIEAPDEQSARRSLRLEGLLVISVDEVHGDELRKFSLTDRFPINTKDRVFFCRQLSMMTKSGLTLINSLKIMSREFPKEKMRNVLNEVIEDLQTGLSFADSLGKHPKVFTELLIKVVHCAEQSGEMNSSLLEVADQLEFKDAMKKKTISACAYPGVVFLMAIAVGIFMVFKIIPKFDEFLSKKNIPLPNSTQFVIGISRVGQDYWLHIISGLCLLGVGLILMFKNPTGRRIQENFLLSLPVFGKVFKSSVLANFSTTSALLLKSGLGVVESLKLNSNLIPLLVYKDLLNKASENVVTGQSLTDSMRHRIIPSTVTNIISVGEETGALQDVLAELGEFYNEELKRSVNTLVTAIEPALLIIVGGVVAVVYFALFQAIVRLMGA